MIAETFTFFVTGVVEEVGPLTGVVEDTISSMTFASTSIRVLVHLPASIPLNCAMYTTGELPSDSGTILE